MTKPKSKSKMIKALRKWDKHYWKFWSIGLILRSKSEITKLFNEAIENKVINIGCSSCGENMPKNECLSSKRKCGHHCNHSWSHDSCCWCGKEWREGEE
jgi:hypothetical protein